MIQKDVCIGKRELDVGKNVMCDGRWWNKTVLPKPALRREQRLSGLGTLRAVLSVACSRDGTPVLASEDLRLIYKKS